MPLTTFTLAPIPRQTRSVAFALYGTFVYAPQPWDGALLFWWDEVAPIAVALPVIDHHVSSFTFGHPGLPRGTYRVTVLSPGGGSVLSNQFAVV